MSGWERRRILVWGKTRPEVSQNYREIVCTGGVFEDTGSLVRIYPIPLRYLDDEQYFKKYQWIEAEVQRASDRDSRPESYRIRAQGLSIVGQIDTGKEGTWRERARWILQPQNVFRSVEALQAKQQLDGTSLGIVRPKKVVQASAETYSKPERDAFWRKYQDVARQIPLALDDEPQIPKPLTPPDYRFRIRFTCDDPACTLVHKFGILDWEIDAHYFKMKNKYGEATAKQKVVDHLQAKVCGSNIDTHFFLGNISTHPQEFTIVGLWYPKKPAPTLLDQL